MSLKPLFLLGALLSLCLFLLLPLLRHGSRFQIPGYGPGPGAVSGDGTIVGDNSGQEEEEHGLRAGMHKSAGPSLCNMLWLPSGS